MRNKKRNRAYRLAAALLCAVSLIVSVQTAGAAVYQRWDTVADEQKIQAGFANEKTTEKKVHPNAWKKINGVCYNGSGVVIPGAITRGIDVSEWQDKINWEKAKQDIDFAFIRISYGMKHMDLTYDYNMEQANLAGVPVGTYVYSLAVDTDTALKEAKLAIEKMKGYTVSYPVVIDLEYSEMEKLPPKKVAEIALAFCNEVKKAGYYPMIYSNTYWYNNHIAMDMLSGVDMWLARYGDTISAPSHSDYKYTIWQSTDGDGGGTMISTKGLIGGIPLQNNVDVNFGFTDYTKIITPRTGPVPEYDPSESADTSNDEPSEDTMNGWKKEDGNTFYYKDGDKLTGWQEIGGIYYYFDLSDGSLYKNQIISQDGEFCYVNVSGERTAEQWVTYSGKKYYIGPDGYALKGVKKVDGTYYYFHSSKAYMYKNKKVIGKTTGNIYFFGSDGARCCGGLTTVTENGVKNTYYFNKNGKAHKGWLTLKGKKYYFYNGTSMKKSGVRAENITLVSKSGVVSVFDKNGVCTKRYRP